jgi:hypothetical protein
MKEKYWKKHLAQHKQMAYGGSAPLKKWQISVENQILYQKLEKECYDGWGMWKE